MENASDAILMAGAMLIFVIALTVAMTVFSQARATIDMVAYVSDETNYYEYLDTTNNSAKNRIVGLETVIPTLYKYYKENYTVVFLDSNGNGLKLYKSQTNALNWSGNTMHTESGIPTIASKYPGMENEKKQTGNWICSFDLNEEGARGEPWLGGDTKENLEAFLEGDEFRYTSYREGEPNAEYYDYSQYFSKGSFIAQYADSQFIETIGEYSTDDTNDDESLSSQLNQGIRDNKNKRVIIYQLID